MTFFRADTALDAVSAWSTLGADVIALVALVTAFVVGRKQVREAQAARELTKRLDIERSQPYVVAYIESSETNEQIVQLVIKNFGLTAAHNLRVQIDPWPERSKMNGEYREVGIPTTMPILAPGQEWKTFWDVASERSDSDLPDCHEGVLIYDGLDNRQIETPVVLDWAMFRPRMYMDIKTIRHAAKTLAKIEEILKNR